VKDINKKLVKFFSAMADETRIKIIISISKSPKTVNDIHKNSDKTLTLSAISHQLKLLENSDIVKYEKKGRERYYSLSGDFCWCMLKDAIKHFNKRK